MISMPSPRAELGHLATAVQFLTRLPVPGGAHADLAAAARYFPLVGLLIGLLSGLVYAGFQYVGLSALPSAALAAAAQIMLTGGLHEDGLADLADGLGGGATAERALDIMRDSRIGAYGAMALGLALILRVTALAQLPPAVAVPALVTSLALGRFFVVWTLRALPYARKDGLASSAQAPVLKTFLVAAAITAGVVAATGTAGLAALLAGGIVWAWLLWRLRVRLGGYTGDGLGAVEQVTGIAALLAMSAMWT